MAKFYFTYGSDDPYQAHKGGWTEVEAENARAAEMAFRAYYPKNEHGLMPYSWMYAEREFNLSSMPENGNFGAFCHDRITLTREVL